MFFSSYEVVVMLFILHFVILYSLHMLKLSCFYVVTIVQFIEFKEVSTF